MGFYWKRKVVIVFVIVCLVCFVPNVLYFLRNNWFFTVHGRNSLLFVVLFTVCSGFCANAWFSFLLVYVRCDFDWFSYSPFYFNKEAETKRSQTTPESFHRDVLHHLRVRSIKEVDKQLRIISLQFHHYVSFYFSKDIENERK